jgi:hypothetical protein
VPDSNPEIPLESDGFPVMPEPPKKKNTTRIVLIVVLILAIIGCGIAAAIVLMNPPKGGNSGGPNGNPSSSTDTPDTPDSPDEPSAEEVALTDESIKTDIKEKLSALLSVGWANDSLMDTRSITYDDITLLKEGDLNRDKKALHLTYGLNSSELTGEQVQYILDTDGDYFTHIATSEDTVEQAKESFKQWGGMYYNGSSIRDLYKRIYGEEFPKGADIKDTDFSCGYLGYSEKYDIYYFAGGCGGVGNQRSYYVDKYTTDGTNAYVYIYAGMYELEGKVYCDVAVDPTTLSDKVCADQPSEALIDETNHEKYTPYRIIFTKSEDGNFYFSSAESL